ncbi:MAG: hypothetical protein AB1938_04675 [Myxococcota bacterium]
MDVRLEERIRMPPIKPKYPDVKLAGLNTKLDRVKTELDALKKADGTIDFKALDRRADAADGAVGHSLRAIADSFTRRETVGSGCDSTYRRVTPEKLSAPQVRKLFETLAKTKQQLADALGADATLSRDEAKRAARMGGLAGELAKALVDEAEAPWEHAMVKWAMEVQKVDFKVDARKTGERDLQVAASLHAATPDGAEAIAWAYRAVLVDPSKHFDYQSADRALKKAETSFLAHLPIIGRNATKKGHLDDGEVKKFLGTDDLAKFVRQKKAEVEARVGDYQKWLAGAGIPNAELTRDPDYQDFVPSSC